MHYLVDGYNVLFSISQSEDLQKKREAFLANLDEHAASFSSIMTVVFDGHHRLGEESGYQYFADFLVIFSPGTQTADEYILETLFASSCPSSFTVITEDRGLTRQVKSGGGHVRGVRWFLHWIVKKSRVPKEKPDEDSPFHRERLRRLFEKEIEE
ncbi:MAG: NYN domain-containing protein [Chlamydiota bacterium]